MGWEEDYRQSQILAHTREMAETLKNIEHEQWKQNTYGSSSGGGGGIPLPSGKTMLKILGVMIVFGAVIFPGSFFVMCILLIIFMEMDVLSGCTFVVDMPDYQVVSAAIAAILGLTAFILLVRLVKRL